MIKDAYQNKVVSDYGRGTVFLINSIYQENPPSSDDSVYVSKIKKGVKQRGFYILKEELLEENSYPYQSLLFKEAENFTGIIADTISSENVILTPVRNGIPVASYLMSADNWRTNIIRIAAINDLPTDDVAIKEISLERYLKTIFTEKFTSPDDVSRDRIPLSASAVVTVISVLALLLYSYKSFTSYSEKKQLESELKYLQSQKNSLTQQLSNAAPEIDLAEYYRKRNSTLLTLSAIREILRNSPAARVVKSQGQTIILENVSPTIYTLRKYNPQVVNNGVSLTLP